MGQPYLQLKMAYVGLIQFGLTVYLLCMALIHINEPTVYGDINTHRRTLWALEHYEINEKGEKHYNYTDPDTGEISAGILSNSWFDWRLKGKYVYLFGFNFDNYCWPRQVPATEWLPSLFRSGQLKRWVQIPLRAAVLLGMTFRVFQAIVLSCMRLYRNPDSKIDIVLGKLFVLNELLLNVFLFMVSNYLVTPDRKYYYLFGPALIAAYTTFGFKMLFSIWHLGFHPITVIRLFLLGGVMSTATKNYNNFTSYLEYNYCDHFVNPLLAGYELATVGCLLISELLDIIQTKNLECVLGPTESADRFEEQLQKEGIIS